MLMGSYYKCFLKWQGEEEKIDSLCLFVFKLVLEKPFRCKMWEHAILKI